MPSSRTVMMATGRPPERVVGDQREHRAEHEHLVGQRVEEGAAAGGALPAGEVAVDAVGDAERDPEADRRPRRAVGHDHAEERHGEQQARDGDEVGRRGQRRRPELVGAHRPARTSGSAWLSGPSAPVMRTGVERARPRGASGTTTMPSISGASRWLRATPGASTSTSTSVPTRSSRRAAVMASWRSRSSASRSSTSGARHHAVEVGGVGAVLPGVGEEPAPVELGGVDEGEQLVVVGLGLARVADDEVRPERGRRAPGRGCRRCGRGTGRRRPTGACGAPAAPTRAAATGRSTARRWRAPRRRAAA